MFFWVSWFQVFERAGDLSSSCEKQQAPYLTGHWKCDGSQFWFAAGHWRRIWYTIARCDDGSSTLGSSLTVGSSVCAVPREVDARRIPESVEVGSSTVAELTDSGQARLSVSVDTLSAHVTRSHWSSHACARESLVPASGVSCVAETAAASAASSVACRTARSSAVVGLCMHDDGSSMHGARNSGGTGGLLPVQRSTSCCLDNSWSDTVRVHGPTGTKRVKGGVSGPAEDLRPVAEVAAGVNFRPAGGVRGQVAGSLPRRQAGTGNRQVGRGAVTPSLHPEVLDTRFASPGDGLDIRQSMGWTKVCGTAPSGIWVLKVNARTCMFPANLDHPRVEWMKRCAYKTAWVTPGHDCLCSYKYGHGAAVRPQINNAIWDG